MVLRFNNPIISITFYKFLLKSIYNYISKNMTRTSKPVTTPKCSSIGKGVYINEAAWDMGTCCYGCMANRGSIVHDQIEKRARHNSSTKNNNILFKQLLMTLNRFFRNTIQEAVECTVRKSNKLNKQ